MKNKEKYLDEILEMFSTDEDIKIENCNFRKKHILKKDSCSYVSCEDCSKRVKEWLDEEYEDPIKLKQWEYDILAHCDNARRTYIQMKNLGYFKGTSDDLTVDEILSNCEIVADDYSDFDEECK